MDDRAPNSWLVLAMPYFCFVPTLPVSYQNLLAKEQYEYDDDIKENKIINWSRKPRKKYKKKSDAGMIEALELVRSRISIILDDQINVSSADIYRMFDAIGQIPNGLGGDKMTKKAFYFHVEKVRAKKGLKHKHKYRMILDDSGNMTIQEIAKKYKTTELYVKDVIKNNGIRGYYR